MGRMDRYEENKENVLSRTVKNEELYKDVYLNNSLVDINKLMNNSEIDEKEEPKEQEISINKIYYEERNYNLNDFLADKRKEIVNDNLPRSLDQKIKKDEDEISKIVSEIEEKENDGNFFQEFLADDNTNTISDNLVKPEDKVVSDSVIDNYVMNKELDETHSFMDQTNDISIPISNKKKKIKKKPFIILTILTAILILVVFYIIFKPN